MDYETVRAILMAHLDTPFGHCLCGLEFREIDDTESWADHVAALISEPRTGVSNPTISAARFERNAGAWRSGQLTQHVHDGKPAAANGLTIEEAYRQEASRWSSLADRLKESGD